MRLHAYNAGCVGSIPGEGTKIPHAAQPKNKTKPTTVTKSPVKTYTKTVKKKKKPYLKGCLNYEVETHNLIVKGSVSLIHLLEFKSHPTESSTWSLCGLVNPSTPPIS